MRGCAKDSEQYLFEGKAAHVAADGDVTKGRREARQKISFRAGGGSSREYGYDGTSAPEALELRTTPCSQA